MPPTVGICTDSGSQLPAVLIERFGVEVVPLTVTIDGVDHLEGVDLDTDAFYAHYLEGHRPDVVTTSPSSGQFAVAFEDLIARGCTEVLSVHGSAVVAATVNAARLAAHSTPAPVRLVEPGTTGFGTACAVWAAADALAAGATLDEAARLAEQVGPQVGNAFVWNRGRANCDGPVLVHSHRGETLDEIARVGTMTDAINSMAAYAIAWGDRLRVGVGHSDAASEPLADALAAAIGEAANVLELVRFRIGPSVGTHTGPGSAGCVMLRC